MQKKKLKKSIWLPLTLTLYCAAMTWYFGPRLIQDGMAVKLWISVGAEILVIIGLFLALRRKEKLKEKWSDKSI